MSEIDKVQPSHLHRLALVYVRQSSVAQVEQHRESTLRQYALAERAAALGWPAARITVIDEDLGLSGASAHHRGGFARMAADVALGHVGLILGLEVSRLALRLTVNARKSAVDRPWNRKFLGFTVSRNGTKLNVADKAIDKLKGRVRELTRRTRGHRLTDIVAELRVHVKIS